MLSTVELRVVFIDVPKSTVRTTISLNAVLGRYCDAPDPEVSLYMPCVYCMYLYSAKIYEILHAIVWTLNVYLSISICVYDRYV